MFTLVSQVGENVKELIGEGDSHRNTILHLAAGTNDHRTAEVCLQNGADIDARNSDNETPLHVATVKGNLQMVQVLVKKGACVSAKNAEHKTILHRCVTFNIFDDFVALFDLCLTSSETQLQETSKTPGSTKQEKQTKSLLQEKGVKFPPKKYYEADVSSVGPSTRRRSDEVLTFQMPLP